MPSKQMRRQQIKAQKQKSKAKVRASRSSRKGTSKAKVSIKTTRSWTLGECYVSSGWHKRNAQVKAIISRRSAEGRVAAVTFELDLAQKGLINIETRTDLDDDRLQGILARHSTEEKPLLSVEAAVAATIVRQAAEWGVEQGHQPPVGWTRAVDILDDIPNSDEVDLLLGPEVEEQTKKDGGIWTSMKRTLGLKD